MDALFDRRPPTVWERLSSSPLLFLSRLLYRNNTQSRPGSPKIRVVCISDTHNTHHSQPLPDGDILIHAGDLTESGTQAEVDNVLSWLDSQPHPHKVFIAGNHDTFLANMPDGYVSTKFPSLIYLQDSSAQIVVHGRTLRFYGSPWTPKHGSWVFQYLVAHDPWYSASEKLTPEYQSAEIWSRIPLLTDVLITHGPPLGHLDNNVDFSVEKAASGCYALLTKLWFIRPKLHVFGHIHAGRGMEAIHWDEAQKAYEEILAGRQRWIDVMKLIWYKVFPWSLKRGGDRATLMVNAAVVGGIRDEKKMGAIMVEI